MGYCIGIKVSNTLCVSELPCRLELLTRDAMGRGVMQWAGGWRHSDSPQGIEGIRALVKGEEA